MKNKPYLCTIKQQSPMKAKAVIYARVSSISDRQSTTRQVADLTKYASLNGLEVCKVFEEHISGVKKNSERPVLCECLSYCEANNVDLLLLSELSRLGRNVWEVTENVKHCIDSKLNVYFQKEGFSLFGEDGKENPFTCIFTSVLATCASLERDNIAFRLNSGRAQYVANGGKLGRKQGSCKTNELLKQEYPNVIKELKRGTSIRRTAKLCDVSTPTVQKIKKAFSL